MGSIPGLAIVKEAQAESLNQQGSHLLSPKECREVTWANKNTVSKIRFWNSSRNVKAAYFPGGKFKKGKSLGMKKNYPEKIEGRKLFLQKKADKSTCLSESQTEVTPSCQTLQTCGL